MGRHTSSLELFKYAETFETHHTGDLIFKAGEAGTNMYVVKAGTVELRVNDVTIETLKAGQIFGEMALLDAETRSASAVAASDCQLVSIDKEKLKFLVRQTPYFALEVMQIMAKRLRRMNQGK